MGSENTPPASPGIPVPEGDDEMYEDEIGEEIPETEMGAEVYIPRVETYFRMHSF